MPADAPASPVTAAGAVPRMTGSAFRRRLISTSSATTIAPTQSPIVQWHMLTIVACALCSHSPLLT